MSEKMLVTQALDERDLLVKKIQDKIAKASFADVKKRNEEKVLARVYFGRKDQSSRSIRPPFTEKMITFHGGIDHLSRRGDHPQSFSL